MKGVTSTTNTGWGGGEVENRFQVLVLEVDTCDTPEGGVQFEMEFESMMEVGGIEVRVEDIAVMTI